MSAAQDPAEKEILYDLLCDVVGIARANPTASADHIATAYVDGPTLALAGLRRPTSGETTPRGWGGCEMENRLRGEHRMRITEWGLPPDSQTVYSEAAQEIAKLRAAWEGALLEATRQQKRADRAEAELAVWRDIGGAQRARTVRDVVAGRRSLHKAEPGAVDSRTWPGGELHHPACFWEPLTDPDYPGWNCVPECPTLERA